MPPSSPTLTLNKDQLAFLSALEQQIGGDGLVNGDKPTWKGPALPGIRGPDFEALVKHDLVTITGYHPNLHVSLTPKGYGVVLAAQRTGN